MDNIRNTINKCNQLKRFNMILVGIALGGGFLLVNQFQDQISNFLPYLILLLCPLMHLFMHRGHGGHGGHGESENQTKQTEDTSNTR